MDFSKFFLFYIAISCGGPMLLIVVVAALFQVLNSEKKKAIAIQEVLNALKRPRNLDPDLEEGLQKHLMGQILNYFPNDVGSFTWEGKTVTRNNGKIVNENDVQEYIEHLSR